MKKAAVSILGLLCVSFLAGCGDSYYIVENPDVDSDAANYGTITQEHEDFTNQEGSSVFYYDMECFYFDETYPAVLNETLQTYYDSIKEGYESDAKTYAEGSGGMTPYDSLLFQYVTYAGDDYVSLVFNNVAYMGGAHPYSAFDGITIDCGTGEMVSVGQFIDDSEEEIGEQLKALSGMDVYEPDEWDYYLTDKEVVFFYYDPHIGEFVATRRTR